MFLLKLSCFLNDPVDVGNLISGSSVFLKPAWTSASSSQRSSDHKHMDLFMDFLFYSTGLYVFLFMIMLFWLLQICSLFRDQVMWCLFILFMGFMKLMAKEKRKASYTYLNAEFQRIARRDKKTFLSEQCKETVERLEISSGELDIPRKHFLQRWAQ